MKEMKKSITLILVSFLITSCVSVSTEQIRSANYGTKPTRDGLITELNGYLNKILIDPYSAKTQCSKVHKGWARKNIISSPYFGYFIICDVNSKNRFGGYAGSEVYIAITNSNKRYSRFISNRLGLQGGARGVLYDY